jgi:hypothetical protein
MPLQNGKRKTAGDTAYACIPERSSLTAVAARTAKAHLRDNAGTRNREL